jgi:aryl carrier-like protein
MIKEGDEAVALFDGSLNGDSFDVERDIGRICAEVLGRPARKIKMDKSFLAHGGDSLLAIKLMARCDQAGYAVTIHDILQSPTIRRLCQAAKPKESHAKPRPTTKGDTNANKQLELASIPLTEMQELYVLACATQTRLIRLEPAIPKDEVLSAFAVLGSRHTLLQMELLMAAGGRYEMRSAAEGRLSFNCETRKLGPNFEESDIIALMDSTSEWLDSDPQSALFSAKVFVEESTSVARYVALITSRAILDATSLEISQPREPNLPARI